MEQFTVKDRVEHYKRKYHMTNLDVAKRLNISEATLSKYIADPGRITYKTMKKMCDLWHCSIEYLMEGR